MLTGPFLRDHPGRPPYNLSTGRWVKYSVMCLPICSVFIFVSRSTIVSHTVRQILTNKTNEKSWKPCIVEVEHGTGEGA